MTESEEKIITKTMHECMNYIEKEAYWVTTGQDYLDRSSKFLKFIKNNQFSPENT